MDDKPQYKHDCERCRFLGRYEQFDLYFCESPVTATVVARFGNDGSQYISGLHWADERYPELLEAKNRAIAANLITSETRYMK